MKAGETHNYFPQGYKRIKIVGSLTELFNTPFGGPDEVNCVLFPRRLRGDFNGLASAIIKNRARGMDSLPGVASRFPDEVSQIQSDHAEISKGFQTSPRFDLRISASLAWDRTRAPDGFHVDGCANIGIGRILCCYNDPVTEWIRNEDASVPKSYGGVFEPIGKPPVFSFRPGDIFRIASLGGRNLPDHGKLFIHRTPPSIMQRKGDDPPRILFVAG